MNHKSLLLKAVRNFGFVQLRNEYIETFICNCNIITNHNMSFDCNLIFDKSMAVPGVVEKLIGLIAYKIFNRLKQFIENIRI